MLQRVDVGTQSIDGYRDAVGGEAIEHLRRLAGPLAGARILHLNATPYGGGVAEILRSEIPLLRDLGLEAQWRIITGDERFFNVTKALHNGLQGAALDLPARDKETYLRYSRQNAEVLEGDYDLVVVHDPQPLALPSALDGGPVWVWRCHIDTSEPNPEHWEFLSGLLEPYACAVFTLGSFVPPGFPLERVEVVPPAIDPLSPKNMDLDERLTRRVLGWIGVDTEQPLITQVSRFDSWKDPLGVVRVYELLREEVPDLQLALVGSMALDDPEGWEIYNEILEAARGDPGVHVFTNLTGVGNIEVNAFQRSAQVVLQKSLREGFGLVVSEALWKTTPVVAGRAGGIPLQLREGAGGYLIDSVEECAERVLRLLKDPEERAELGTLGREIVRERFLLPRLIADELQLYASLLGVEVGEAGRTRAAGAGAEPRDPVCGMRNADPDPPRATHRGRQFVFCSAGCREMFLAAPDTFLRGGAAQR